MNFSLCKLSKRKGQQMITKIFVCILMFLDACCVAYTLSDIQMKIRDYRRKKDEERGNK